MAVLDELPAVEFDSDSRESDMNGSAIPEPRDHDDHLPADDDPAPGRVVRHKVHTANPMSVDDAARYPLFTDDLLELMRTLIPRERRGELAVAVVVTARLQR